MLLVILTFGKDAQQSDFSIFLEIVCKFSFIGVLIRPVAVRRFLAFFNLININKYQISQQRKVKKCWQ